MKKILAGVLLGAATLMAMSALTESATAQTTTTKPPAKPATAAKPAATKARPAARPAAQARRPVFVPPAPIVELDEAPVVAGLPTVLDTESRDRYRRIFQAQAAGQWGQADAEIARQTDKTLMGYVGAQRLLSQGYPARYDELATWLREYNDHPDAPAIYKLALARRTPG